MADQHRSFPFRWVLPFAQLAVCVVLLWPVRGNLAFAVKLLINSHPHELPGRIVVLDPKSLPPLPGIPDFQRAAEVATKVEDIRMAAPLALNIPVLVAQLPYILARPAKREWMPKGMPPDTWRVLSWPFVGIIFWWFLGRSVEALPKARRSVVYPRISRIEAACASILFGTGLVALVGMLTTTPDDRRDVKFMTILAGGLLWGLLATVTIAARFMQWRIAKRNAAARATTDPSPGITVS
jgi:hypothetical protein